MSDQSRKQPDKRRPSTDGNSCDLSNPPFEAYEGRDPYLVVAYAHADATRVFPDIARLRALGYRIWYDEGIDPGNEPKGLHSLPSMKRKASTMQRI